MVSSYAPVLQFRQRGRIQNPYSVGSSPTRGTTTTDRIDVPSGFVSAVCDNLAVYSSAVRRHAVDLMESGLSLRRISMSTGVNRTTLRDWRDHPEKLLNRTSCPRCSEEPSLPEPHAEYAYLPSPIEAARSRLDGKITV